MQTYERHSYIPVQFTAAAEQEMIWSVKEMKTCPAATDDGDCFTDLEDISSSEVVSPGRKTARNCNPWNVPHTSVIARHWVMEVDDVILSIIGIHMFCGCNSMFCINDK